MNGDLFNLIWLHVTTEKGIFHNVFGSPSLLLECHYYWLNCWRISTGNHTRLVSWQ